MEIIEKSLDFQLNKETAIAIGKFDGVHVGHRRLLQEILDRKDKGLLACVFTFDKSPAALFGKGDEKVLTTLEEKRRIFDRMGVDILVEFPLTFETAATPPEDFARLYLSKALRGRFIAAGEDLSFGRKGEGNAQLLREMSEELKLEVKTIPKVCREEQEVSSTYIRGLLEQGRMEAVTTLLGEPYSFYGRVCHGHHIGRTLGFPTVNIYPETDKLLPPFGVYFSKVEVDGHIYGGISNIGCKPTISGREQVGLETYLYDFDADLYDKEIRVSLLAFRRPEQKFSGLDALKKQLDSDIAAGEKFLIDHCD